MLTELQQTAVDAVKSGRNTFITGPGGVGKSFIIRELQKLDGLQVTSTTAITAGAVGGITFHSWAGLGLGLDSPERILTKMSPSRKSFIRNTRILLLDEVSMLHPDLMDKADAVLRKVCEDKPFGGKQVVAVGDFYQLPPVEKDRKAPTRYAFESKVWEALEFKTVQLTEIMRQSDVVFQRLLNAIRTGDIDGVDFEPFYERETMDPKTRTDTFTSLSSRNKDVDAQNNRILSRLPGMGQTYVAQDGGHDFLVKGSQLPAKLVLKTGAVVMCLANSGSLYNGSVGEIVGFSRDKWPIFQDKHGDEYEIQPIKREVYQGTELVPVKETAEGNWTTEDGEMFLTHEVAGGKVLRPRVVASRFALPLRLAWWTTIHKSQGATMDAVHADISGCFAPGHLYTALSRVRSLDGLTLTPLQDWIVSPKVTKFYQTL